MYVSVIRVTVKHYFCKEHVPFLLFREIQKDFLCLTKLSPPTTDFNCIRVDSSWIQSTWEFILTKKIKTNRTTPILVQHRLHWGTSLYLGHGPCWHPWCRGINRNLKPRFLFYLMKLFSVNTCIIIYYNKLLFKLYKEKVIGCCSNFYFNSLVTVERVRLCHIYDARSIF